MICYVEDDKNIRELVVYTLLHSDLEAVGFPNGEEFFAYMKDSVPDLVMLDIMLPDMDGMEILRRLRMEKRTELLPIIMVTAKGSEFDKVTGLDMGADDYIAKPFGMMELVARVKALLRRHGRQNVSGAIMSVQGLTLDEKARKVLVDGKEVTLTFKEFELLRFLMENRGTAFTREHMLSTVWGYDYDGGTRTVDVHVQTLRQKLGEKGSMVETVRGVGYRFGG